MQGLIRKVASFQADNAPFREPPQLGSNLSQLQVLGNHLQFRVANDLSLPPQQGSAALISQHQLETSKPIQHLSITQSYSQPFSTSQILNPAQVQDNQRHHLHHVNHPAQIMSTSYFNGALLGTSHKNIGKGRSVLTEDRTMQSWVKEQQEKYLRYHIKLYELRKK